MEREHEAELYRLLHGLVAKIHELTLTERRIMSALENLTAAITRLQTSVDAAVTDINVPHPTDAQVQTAADAVNAQSDRLDAAVAPTPPVA